MSNYVEMWKDLGMDLENHDNLCAVLPVAFRDVYLSQENRPEGMGFWDMVVERIMTAEEGETVEILETVPCSHMPAKVLEALRQRSDVTLVLNLRDGRKLILDAKTAPEHDPYVLCYAIDWLTEYYSRRNPG